MKRIVFFAILSCLTMSSYAQEYFPNTLEKHEKEDPAKMFLGGAITFWANDKTVKLDLCPEMGYQFNETWGIGLLLGYQHEKEYNTNITSTSFKLSPFARWYYVHKGPFNLFLDGGVALDWDKTKRKGFEIGLRPGACIDLTEGLCLCLRMGFAGFRDNYHSGEEPNIGESGFGLRFAPEELMIGLELEL